jgi:hypothetical protein
MLRSPVSQFPVANDEKKNANGCKTYGRGDLNTQAFNDKLVEEEERNEQSRERYLGMMGYAESLKLQFSSSFGHRPEPVIAVQCLIAKVAHPATLQYLE